MQLVLKYSMTNLISSKVNLDLKPHSNTNIEAKIACVNAA